MKKHTLNPVFEEILKVKIKMIMIMKMKIMIVMMMINEMKNKVIMKISVCDAAWRGGAADNVDLSLAQVGHLHHHQSY